MIKIAFFGKNVKETDVTFLTDFFHKIDSKGIHCYFEKNYFSRIQPHLPEKSYDVFESSDDLKKYAVPYLISLGGDGTLLELVKFTRNTKVAVLGINLGRLGFLSNVPVEKATQAIDQIINGQYKIDHRTMLELKTSQHSMETLNLALNDFTIHKRDTGSMIVMECYLNGEFFNAYWGDGIIVSTPTGSTGYSLSCGGPIIFPDSENFVLTPVAPHNLNVRPIIISDKSVVSFRVKGRGTNHLISLDSRYEAIEYGHEIAVQKAGESFKMIKLDGNNYIDSLSVKLMWGADTRNF